MSKITKWKTEKTKVKVVFRLQFHATHVPQAGWDKLFVSFIPTDTGKVTAKTTRANVRNGSCKWSDPIYETTRLLQDHKNKKYDDKLYKLMVAMGSSRSSILGDATINLADYADALKPLSISLSLQGCNFGTVLHVTVQLLTSKTGFREFEQQRELREKGIQMLTDLGSKDEIDRKVAAFSETSIVQNEKVGAKVRFKSDGEFPTLEEEGELNEDCADSAVGVDGSSYTSESLYAEKHDISSTHENESLKSTISGEIGSLSNNQFPGPENAGMSGHQLLPQGSGDWVHGWCSDISLENDSAAAIEENNKLRACLEVAESSILDLKLEVSNLKAQTDDMTAETQRFAEQLVAEIASGEELARKVSVLKIECSRFKDDFEKLRLYDTNEKARHFDGNSMVGPLAYANKELVRVGEQSPSESSNFFIHDSEMNWLQNLFLLEDKIKMVKEKACFRNKEIDLGLIADLESLECLTLNLRHSSQKLAYSLNIGLMAGSDFHDPDLVKGLPESISLLEKPSGVVHFQKPEGISDNNLHHGGDLSVANVKQYDSQGLFHCSNIPNSMPIEIDQNTFMEMKVKITELSKELGESQAESSNLTKKMDQMEYYYEKLVHELEERQQLMHAELQAIKDEQCSCLYTISTLESQAQRMQTDRDEQFTMFVAEKHALDSVNMELEKRVLASEMALRRQRQNYSLAVDQLLKDLETLSFQVMSMYEVNEDLTRQEFTDAAQPSLQRCNDEKSEEICSPQVKFDSINTFLNAQRKVRTCGTWTDTFLMDKSEKSLLQANTVTLEPEGQVAVKAAHGARSKDVHFNSVCEVQDFQGLYKDRHCKMLKSLEDEEIDNANLSALNTRNSGLVPLPHQLNQEQTLLTNQAVLVGKQVKVLPANNLLDCQKEEICIPVDFSKPVLDSQIADKAENKELKRKLSELEFLLEGTKCSLLLQENIQQKSENKLRDMEMLNLYLEIFSLTLLETLRGAHTEIIVMQGKQEELIWELEQSTNLKDLLIAKLQSSSDHVKLLQENEAKNNVRCDELVLKYNFMENSLQLLLKERSAYIEKLKESEMRFTDLVDYKHRYEACAVEKEELKFLLEREGWEKVNLENEVVSLKHSMKILKLDLDMELSTRSDHEKTVASLQSRLENLRRKMSSFHETIVGGVITTDIPRELDGKGIEEMLSHLEQLQCEAHVKLLQLSQEKMDAEDELRHSESQVTIMKEKAETDVKVLTAKLEDSTAKSEKIHGELVDMTNKYMLVAEAGKKHLQEEMALSEELSCLRNEMQSVFEEKKVLAQKVLSLKSASEELDKTKVILNDCISENESLRFSLQSANADLLKHVKELVCLKETLGCLQDELHSVGDSKEKLEAQLANITSQLNEKCQMHLKRQTELEFLLEEAKVSISLKEELQQETDNELADMKMLNVYLNINSLVLQETLTNAHAGSMILKEKNEELTRLLDHSVGLKELLMVKLQTALDTIKVLQENETKIMANCDDLILQNTALEKKLQGLLEENSHFAEKFKDYEMESRCFKQKYDICNAEKEEMQSLLVKRDLQTVALESEVILLKESLRAFQLDLDNESSKRDDLEKLVVALEGRLQELRTKMFSFAESGLVETAMTDLLRQLDGTDIETTISDIEELQHKAFEKFLQCYKEKKEIEEQRDFSQRSLEHAESQHLLVKEKSEMELKFLIAKLDESNAKLEQLHAELVDMTGKYKIASEREEKHVEENEKLFAELSDLKAVMQSVTEDNNNLSFRVSSLENSIEEFEKSRKILNDYITENKILNISLQTARGESVQQKRELDCLKGRLQELRRNMFSFGESSLVETATDLPRGLDCQDTEATISHVEELQHKVLENFLQCYQEKKETEEQLDFAQRSLKHSESQLLLVKENSETDMKIVMSKLHESDAKLEKIHAELTDMTSKYEIASEMEEKHVEKNRKLSAELSDLKAVLQSVTEDNKNLSQKVSGLEDSSEEIDNNQRILNDYILENKSLSISLQTMRDESVQQMRELDGLKEHCRCLQDELHFVRESKDELEAAHAHVTFELKGKQEQLISCTEQKAELIHLTKQVSSLLEENSNMRSLLSHSKECQGKLIEDVRCAETEVCNLENNMVTVQVLLMKADIEVVFLKNELQCKMRELCNQIAGLQNHQMKLQSKLQAAGMTLEGQMACEAQSLEQNTCPMLDLLLVTSEFNTLSGKKDFKGVGHHQQNLGRSKDGSEIEQLNGMVMCLEGETEMLKSSRDELDITNVILLTKVDELNNHIVCLSEYGNELNKLRIEHSELTQRLSEQVLKTEEFRNLSIHLQELKGRTDSTQGNDRKTADGPSAASQESLRIAFIREQCETKLQELRAQQHLSRKHGEELLLKLQIALDELEARKKSEAIYVRKNENLSMRVIELEAELQSVLDDMQEKVNHCNQLKTELEVSKLSLLCCKEEKEKLENSLQECHNQRTKLSLELSSIKEELEVCTTFQSQQGLSLGEDLLGKQTYNFYNDISTINPLNSSGKDALNVLYGENSEAVRALINEDGSLCLIPDQHFHQETSPLPLGTAEHLGTSPEGSRLMLVMKGGQSGNDREHLQLISRHIQERDFISSMERLQKELEKMKNENLAPLLDQNEHHTDLVYEERFQREVLQLNMANEQLGNIFPQFNELLESGNSLERVLALEIELAEALQSKKKDTMHFQSSFLKQHHDEEAIFKSFRDINELIKDMLEVKKKNATIETELKEMHNRYSQLSVQFAEVEGEREKLVMTLKNIRTTRKP